MGADLSRRHFLAAGASALGVAALSTACSSGSGSGRTTLTIMGNYPSEVTAQDVSEFEAKHPDIRVKFVAVNPSVLTAMFAAGTPPDLVRDAGVPSTPYLVARDLALDLDPYLARSTVLHADQLVKANDSWRYDGRTQGTGPRYGLAKDYSQDAMFWCNTQAFETAGVDLPSATEPIGYDELLDLGQRLTKRNGAQYSAYGVYPPYDVSLTGGLLNMVASAGGSIFNDDFTAVDFSAPEPKSALAWYLRYAKSGVGPTPVRPLPGGAWSWFDSNRLAMVGYGYWLSGQIATDPSIQSRTRFITAPQFGSKRVSPCFAAVGFWIPKKAKHKDAAWAFFEHFFGGAPATRRAESGWGLPGITTLNDKLPTAKAYEKQATGVQNAEMPHYSVLQFSPYLSQNSIDAALGLAIVKGLDSDMSAGAMADTLNDTLNPLLKQGRELVT